MRRLFFHLLKRYIRTERDRLVILRELFNGVQQDYYEQTMPGNIHNFTVETLLANDWVRRAVLEQDMGTLQIIRNTLTHSVDDAYEQIREGQHIPPLELKLRWHRIETRKGKNRSQTSSPPRTNI